MTRTALPFGTLARRSALKALYELDATSHTADVVIAARLTDDELDKRAEGLFQVLVAGVLTHQPGLDEIINAYAPERDVTQMAIVDRTILRIALFELTILRQTPFKVIISEAANLAQQYSVDSAINMISGVLGSVADDVAAEQNGSSTPA